MSRMKGSTRASALVADTPHAVPGDREIENPASTGSPTITITRVVEENDVVMAEMTLEVRRASGELMRAAMGELFVMRDARIKERRA
jgi:uncharacterized protein